MCISIMIMSLFLLGSTSYVGAITAQVTASRGGLPLSPKGVNIVEWSYNNRTISWSDAWQTSSGVLITDMEPLGIVRLSSSTDKKHIWRGQFKFRGGITLGGQTLGISYTITDDIYVYYNGNSDVIWDSLD